MDSLFQMTQSGRGFILTILRCRLYSRFRVRRNWPCRPRSAWTRFLTRVASAGGCSLYRDTALPIRKDRLRRASFMSSAAVSN